MPPATTRERWAWALGGLLVGSLNGYCILYSGPMPAYLAPIYELVGLPPGASQLQVRPRHIARFVLPLFRDLLRSPLATAGFIATVAVSLVPLVLVSTAAPGGRLGRCLGCAAFALGQAFGVGIVYPCLFVPLAVRTAGESVKLTWQALSPARPRSSTAASVDLAVAYTIVSTLVTAFTPQASRLWTTLNLAFQASPVAFTLSALDSRRPILHTGPSWLWWAINIGAIGVLLAQSATRGEAGNWPVIYFIGFDLFGATFAAIALCRLISAR